MDGDPPDLPTEGYSSSAQDFVRGCLNKIPKARPTYAMLLKHPWLKSLTEYDTIKEEPEENGEVEGGVDAIAESVGRMHFRTTTDDAIVAEWVKAVLDRRSAEGDAPKPSLPALHAAPLNTVGLTGASASNSRAP